MISFTPRYRLRILWIGWAVIVFTLLVTRFTLYWGTYDEDALFSLFTRYMFLTWGGIMLLGLVPHENIGPYLKENHHETWEYLTYSPLFTPMFGRMGMNGFRSVPWLFSKDDLDDPVIRECKVVAKRMIAFILTVFLTFMPLAILVMGPWGAGDR